MVQHTEFISLVIPIGEYCEYVVASDESSGSAVAASTTLVGAFRRSIRAFCGSVTAYNKPIGSSRGSIRTSCGSVTAYYRQV